MLVLSRNRDEGVMIGHGVRVVIAEVRGGKVRLGIVADRSVPIERDEVYAAKHGVTVDDLRDRWGCASRREDPQCEDPQ